MEEYIMDVEIDNERTTLKTFSRTVEGAVDNMVKIEGVQKLFAIGNKNDLCKSVLLPKRSVFIVQFTYLE